jgi:preprotein translocase subunit SecF
VPFEIIPSGTHIDFIGRRHVAFALSTLMLVAAVAAIPIRGVRLGIDFAGGTEVQLRFEDQGAGEGAIRSVARACGVQDPSVVRYGETDAAEFLIRFRSISQTPPSEAGDTECPLTEAEVARLAAVAEATGADAESLGTDALVDRLELGLANAIGPLEILRVEYVGPRVGEELRRDGLLAILIACLMILVYIAFRFSTRFAPGAVIALVHDVGVTAGLFVIFGLEFDLRVLAALLAIMGYSLNDTIIIYDRIRENMALRTKHDMLEVLNLSVNQTLSRTLLTSLTTLGAVLTLLFVGGEVIRSFALAMAIGIVVGTYSSTFIAAPTLLFLEMRFGGGGETGQKPKASEGGAHPPASDAARKPPAKSKARGKSKSRAKPKSRGKGGRR